MIPLSDLRLLAACFALCLLIESDHGGRAALPGAVAAVLIWRLRPWRASLMATPGGTAVLAKAKS